MLVAAEAGVELVAKFPDGEVAVVRRARVAGETPIQKRMKNPSFRMPIVM